MGLPPRSRYFGLATVYPVLRGHCERSEAISCFKSAIRNRQSAIPPFSPVQLPALRLVLRSFSVGGSRFGEEGSYFSHQANLVGADLRVCPCKATSPLRKSEILNFKFLLPASGEIKTAGLSDENDGILFRLVCRNDDIHIWIT